MRFENFLSLVLNEGIEDKGIFKACFLAGNPGAGKAQPLFSKVLTIDGWKTMKEITVGDKVITPDNKHSTVIQEHPQGIKDIYKIILFDGREVYCTEDHLWKVHGFYKNRRRSWTIKNTKELNEKKDMVAYKNRLHLPLPDKIELKSNNLPIDPYMFGLLLGDGCFKNSISISVGKKDKKEFYMNCSSSLKEGYRFKESNDGVDIYIRGHDDHNINYYNNCIKELGLYNKYSYEKFIPDIYKNSSILDRLELIRGLLDSDGYVSKRGQVYFYTTSKNLADDFRYIMWSLGNNTIIHEKTGSYKIDGKIKICKKVYSITILSHKPEELFKLRRKVKRSSINLQKRNNNHNLKNRIEKIEYYGKYEAKCITIENKNGLYITDNFVVTHNSYVAGKIKSGQIEPRIVNTDKFFTLFDNDQWNKRWKEISGKVKILNSNQLTLYINSMLPLAIDGTSSSTSRILKRKGILESFGYDTSMIFVNCSLDTAIERARKRKRKVDENFIKETYERIKNIKPYYQSLFSEFYEVNNDVGELTEGAIIKAFKKMDHFYNSSLKNPVGNRHINEMRENGWKYLDPNITKLDYIKKVLGIWYNT